jgi:hypothetical protein
VGEHIPFVVSSGGSGALLFAVRAPRASSAKTE